MGSPEVLPSRDPFHARMEELNRLKDLGAINGGISKNEYKRRMKALSKEMAEVGRLGSLVH